MSLLFTLHVVLTSPSQNKTLVLLLLFVGNMSCTSWRDNINVKHCNKTRVYTM